MKTLKWNGEYWYVDDRSLLKRMRQWFIWMGGWEKANGEGWQFRTTYGNHLMSPTPISLFGHTITFQSWGWQIRIRRGCYLTCSKTSGLYVSSDGTPPDLGNYPKKGFFIMKRKRR